ncbi:hypothetical protein THER_0720 [Thermodesulfovibrio sp. N1]|uniref:hypothetical protein n=1 Tax=Thermodesulfovibrio sp. N1 TaxID=1871110 RepID=UPI000839E299|nr:hypothetical protein [Thermodesulfovibrio sp. N1]ODA44572.1 hypothetical protein THER_0720 [Thermodesulfovibrio sp. N1]
MKNFLFLIGTMLISTIVFSNSYGDEKKDYEAWLIKEIKNSQLITKACVRNNTNRSVILMIKITGEKISKTGISRSTQSNEIFLKANEEKCSSQISFNLIDIDNDDYQISLECYKDNQLIAKDSIKKGIKSEKPI